MKRDQLEELYKKQYKAVYYYMLSLCHDRELAEDIVSQAFEKAILTLNRSVNNYTHWLMKVSKNLWIDHLRKESKVVNVSIDDLEVPATDYEIPEIINKKDTNQALYKIIDDLNPTDKEIIVLYYFSGSGVSQIAKSMEMSEPNVKVRLHRARLKLRKLMEDMKDEF